MPGTRGVLMYLVFFFLIEDNVFSQILRKIIICNYLRLFCKLNLKKKKICSLVLASGFLIREVGSDDDIRVTDDQLCYIIQTHYVYPHFCGVQSVVTGKGGEYP